MKILVINFIFLNFKLYKKNYFFYYLSIIKINLIIFFENKKKLIIITILKIFQKYIIQNLVKINFFQKKKKIK